MHIHVLTSGVIYSDLDVEYAALFDGLQEAAKGAEQIMC